MLFEVVGRILLELGRLGWQADVRFDKAKLLGETHDAFVRLFVASWYDRFESRRCNDRFILASPYILCLRGAPRTLNAIGRTF